MCDKNPSNLINIIFNRLEELLSTRKREEAVQTLIKIDRVKGMIETIALRKAFLRHLESKRLRKSIPNGR